MNKTVFMQGIRVVLTLIFAFALQSGIKASNTPEGETLVASEKPVQIASAGKAIIPIVISTKCTDGQKKTAAELAAFLKKITGAEFTVEQGDAAKGITLGTLEQFPDESLKESLAIKEVYNGREAFAIRSDRGLIRLIGNTDLGVSHAAYRFLELLGCRWFFMGSAWEIIPAIPALSFDLNESSRPQIWSRKYGFSRTRIKGEEEDLDIETVLEKWRAANRMGESLDVKANHAWNAIPIAFKLDGYPFKKEFEAHPEYFALVNGKRTPPQFCVSNPGLQKTVIQYVNKYFEINPSADMVSLDTADQQGWCTCAECAKLGRYSSQPFYLANLAAKELQKTHPGKMVGVLAYSWHCDPPSFPMEPNVFVPLTKGFNASKFTFDELFVAWSKKGTNMGIYEYFSFWQMDKCMLPGKGPQNKFDELGSLMKNYVDHKVVSIMGDASLSWGVHGFGYYIANKAMWNPAADIKALKKDFYEKAFGPASPAMERYFERLNLSSKPFRGVSLLRDCLGDLEEATVLAKDRPDVLVRLDDLKAYMVYNYLGQKVEDAENLEVEKKAALEWFTWAYRIRSKFMIDWMTFRAQLGNYKGKGTEASKYNEPSWYYKETKDNPWKNEQVVTSQELTERLQKIKEEWGDVPSVAKHTYSDRYVLAKLDAPGKAEKKPGFSGSITQLLASQKGEPLRFKLFSTPSPQIERQDARYSLTTLDGKEVVAGDLPEGENPMELKVPGAGIYYFTCKRGGAGWQMELSDELKSALVVKRDVEFRPQHGTLYFYVPKKTSQISMYIQWGKITVHDPGNQVAYKAAANGKIVTLPVNKGMDGKVWSITGKLRNLWFFNIPNALSLSPEMIFVPKEVAEADGLKVTVE